jgi:uncharacterized integral membrane protein
MTLPSEERPDRDLPPRPPTTHAVPPAPDPTLDRPLPPAAGTGVEPAPSIEPGPGSGSLPVTAGEPAPDTDGGTPTRDQHAFTRIRAAWAGVWAGLVVVILLIVFIGQNTSPVDIHFFWLDGRIPTALALLIAGVGGAIIVLAVGAARILQLRRMMRRNVR